MNDPSPSLPAQGSLVKELYFPTQIYFRDIPDVSDINRKLAQDIYAWREADPAGIERSNMKRTGSWHSPVHMHTRPEFQQFRRMVTATVQLIFDDLGYDPAWRAECDNMWANINPRHGFNRYHVHPNVLWSGAYYVKVPENAGRIYFTDPRVQAQMVAPRFDPARERQREMWGEVFYEPVEGRIVLFPAWLGHEVYPNLSEQDGKAGDRISISFNYVQVQREGTG